MKKKLQAVVSALSALGDAVYLPIYLEKNAHRYPKRSHDWVQGLGFFLRGYAFERQGRSPEYPSLAAEALTLVKTARSRVEKPDAHLARELWASFCDLGGYTPGGEGANAKMNPLNPSGARDAMAVCRQLKESDYNIYAFARTAIEADTILDAQTKIVEIRGVGEKIASLFLRDIALDCGLDVCSLRNQENMQPVDIWVRRTAEIISGNADAATSDAVAAEEMVNIAKNAGCCALRLNAGAWYFGSHVVGSFRALRTALAHVANLEGAVRQYVDRLQSEARALGTFASRGAASGNSN